MTCPSVASCPDLYPLLFRCTVTDDSMEGPSFNAAGVPQYTFSARRD